MKVGGGMVIGKDDATGASVIRKPPKDRRMLILTLSLKAQAARLPTREHGKARDP